MCLSSAASARRTRVGVVRGTWVVVALPWGMDVRLWEAPAPGVRCILVSLGDVVL